MKKIENITTDLLAYKQDRINQGSSTRMRSVSPISFNFAARQLPIKPAAPVTTIMPSLLPEPCAPASYASAPLCLSSPGLS